MRRLWNERKLLLVLNFVVILPDKFNDTLAKFLKVRQRAPISMGLVLPLILRWQWWHHPTTHWRCLEVPVGTTGRSFPCTSFSAFPSLLPWLQIHCRSAQAIPSWGPISIPSAAKPSQERSAFSPTQFYVSFFFFTAKFRLFPQIYFFSAFADSWRLSTICYPCARRSARLQCEPKDARQWGPETPHRVGLFPHLHEILSCKNMQNSQVRGEELPLPKLKVNARPM